MKKRESSKNFKLKLGHPQTWISFKQFNINCKTGTQGQRDFLSLA